MAIASLAVILVWLSREALKLRREMDQRNTDLANSTIKLWNDLKSVSGDDSDRVREEILQRLVRPYRRTVDRYLSIHIIRRIILCYTGSLVGFTTLMTTVVLYRSTPPISYMDFLMCIPFSIAPCAVSLVALGHLATPRSYFVSSLFCGALAISLIFTMLALTAGHFTLSATWLGHNS